MADSLEAQFYLDSNKNIRGTSAHGVFQGIPGILPEITNVVMGRPAYFAGAKVGAQYIKAASRHGQSSFKNKTGRLRRSIRAVRGNRKWPNSATIRTGGAKVRAAHAPLVNWGHRIVRQYNRWRIHTWEQEETAAKNYTGRRTRGREFVERGMQRAATPVQNEVARVMMGKAPTAVREINRLARQGLKGKIRGS